jgi:membrane-bound lytic murein transglycosylase A
LPPAGTPAGVGFPNTGQSLRRDASGRLVPYWDRGEIEDGALDGRHLEICWIRDATDALFIQIQGSARIRLEDGLVVRINYDSHNGYPYTPIGRILIDRKLVPKEEMSMDRIRQWIRDNPDGAKELRRQNRAFVFFRIVGLGDDEGPLGAQGLPLTAGRSIAVDKALHVYGTPFFIEAGLPIDSVRASTPFRRLMIAQDTGSAIVGPARADLYWGSGKQAGQVAGRVRHPGRFTMLIPREIDPVEAGARMPLPLPRPAALIARQPQPKVPLKHTAEDSAAAKTKHK